MKMKSQVAIASLLFAGLLASGCSQQQSTAGSQQVTGSQQTQAAAPAPATPAPAVTAPAPVAKPAPAAPRRPAAPRPVMPKVKAKGHYKGPVDMDPASASALEGHKAQ